MGDRKVLFCLLLVTFFLLPVSSLSAFGKKDSAEVKPIENEWILCITAFDYSLLPQARHITGDVITRDLVTKLQTVSYRLRISPEYAYYESYAWQQSLKTIAKSISAKQDERSLLLYRGETDRKYRANLKKTDDDLAKLREDLAVKEAEKPVINNEPTFQLSQTNINGTYPAPPKPGAEYRFCQNQKSNAFLTGEIQEFHGRYYISVRLYTLHTNSYVFEDDIIFSLEDSGGAVEEIAARLTAVLSGNKPAAVAVRAEPSESQVLINQNYAGRGTVGVREHPPGPVTVAVAAEGYNPQTVEAELTAGELTEITVNLGPLLYADVNVSASKGSASIYQGALYVGEAPLTLRLPIDRLDYLVAETRGGEQAKAVYTSPDMPDDTFNLSLTTKIPPPSGQQRVNKARARSYWAWGSVWISGITAWVTYGIYSSQLEALEKSSSQDFFRKTQIIYFVSTGSVGLLGAAILYYFIEMPRYLNTSTKGATPIVRRGKLAK